jgi:hypothetical protein
VICRQTRVDFDQVDSYQAAGLMYALADKVTLPQRQTAANRCSRARRPHRVERIDVKGQVNRGIVADMCERHFDDTPDSVPETPRVLAP